MKTLLSIASIALASNLFACGGNEAPPPQTPAPAPSTPPPPAETAAATPPPPPATNEGEKLLVAITACTFGGVWGDAEGETLEQRKASSETRCHEATRAIWGADDPAHYEQLRAFDVAAVDEAATKIEKVSKADSVDGPRSEALVKTWRAIALAQKEAMDARRAGDRVKRDYAREPDKLSSDEVLAVAPLKTTTALDMLLKLEVGDLSHDAHAIGLLVAMDRLGTAHALPKHLKIYAVEGAFASLFHVQAPQVPEDATKKLKPGTWLTYLIDAAKAAGHPVPDNAKTAKEKEPLAWAGTAAGISDQLKADASQLPKTTDLADVALRVAHRLDAEYDAEKNALTSELAKPVTKPVTKPKKK